jgi:hypothetical protein
MYGHMIEKKEKQNRNIEDFVLGIKQYDIVDNDDRVVV